MTIRVLADDGSIHQFPDNVDGSIIPAVLARYHASLAQPEPQVSSFPRVSRAPAMPGSIMLLAQAPTAPKTFGSALAPSINPPAGLVGASWQAMQPAGGPSSSWSNDGGPYALLDDLQSQVNSRSVPVPFPVPPIAIPGSRENQEWSRWATPKVQWLLDRIGDAASDVLGPRKLPQCERQYENDSATCRNLRQPADVREGCWSSASERLAYCTSHNGEVGWPPLRKR
jgi:hypothetical protein